MATTHFRNARIYLAATSAAAAVPVVEARSFELSIDGASLTENLAFAEDWSVYEAGAMSWSGSFEFNYDTTQTTIFDAATQKLGPVRWYGYPNASSSSRFYSGMVWVKMSLSGGLNGVGRGQATIIGDDAIYAS